MDTGAFTRFGIKTQFACLAIVAGISTLAIGWQHRTRIAQFVEHQRIAWDSGDDSDVALRKEMNAETQILKPSAKSGNLITAFDTELLRLKDMVFQDPQKSEVEVAKILSHGTHGQLMDCIQFLSSLADENNVVEIQGVLDIAVAKCLDAAESADSPEARAALLDSVEQVTESTDEKIMLHHLVVKSEANEPVFSFGSRGASMYAAVQGLGRQILVACAFLLARPLGAMFLTLG